MKLDRKDIEAIAKSRINRAEGNKLTYYMVVLMSAMVGGMYVTGINALVGWLIVVTGVACFFWYISKVSKRQNIKKAELLKEWEMENK